MTPTPPRQSEIAKQIMLVIVGYDVYSISPSEEKETRQSIEKIVEKALAAERRRVLEDSRIAEILKHIRHAYSCASLDEVGCNCGRNKSLDEFKELLKESAQ